MNTSELAKAKENGQYDTAPVIIPTLCRYNHFVRCVESLKNNKYAKHTDLYISIDYPVNEKQIEGHDMIIKYASELSGFRKIIVIKQERNLGPFENAAKLRSQLEKDGYNRYIFTEDDNEFSPNFLEYMNTIMDYYTNDSSVEAVSGYNYPFSEELYGDIYYSSVYFSAFGYGTWFDRQKEWDLACNNSQFDAYYCDRRKMMALYSDSRNQFCNFVKGYMGYTRDMLDNTDVLSVDLSHGLYLFFTGKRMVFPVKSKVRNWGYDGSGVHCAKTINDNEEQGNHRVYDYSKQEIDIRNEFDIDKVKVCTDGKRIKKNCDSFMSNSFRELLMSRLIYELSMMIGISRTRRIVSKFRHTK